MTDINVKNDFLFGFNGYKQIVTQARFIEISDKQQAYRAAAWILVMAEMLPDSGTGHSFEEIMTTLKEETD